MADLIANQTVSPASAKSLSIITMDKTSTKTDTSLTAAFNQTATSQTDSFDAALAALSIITMAQSANKTDTSLTATFNTEFVSQLVFDVFLTPAVLGNLSRFATLFPMIFHSRTGNPPFIFSTRTNAALPMVFHDRQPLWGINAIANTLTANLNDLTAGSVPTVATNRIASLVSMAQSSTKTDSSLGASFTTEVV